MNKLQAHFSLSPSSHNHLKIKQNILFSPPSKLMSNYANFGTATNKPHWHQHSDQSRPSGQYHYVNDNRHVHQHQQQHQQHYHPEAQKQQQIMAEVHPSILTPFIEQVQLKQKEVDHQKKQHQQQIQGSVKILSHENSQSERDNENYEMINDVFSKHLVPPPPSMRPTVFSIGHHDAPQHQQQHNSNNNNNNRKKQEKLNKFNLSMKSPLQDASRFNYENVVSTNRPSTPNVFVHLNNRTKDNVYKQHKQLHPAYKKKPFLPTPYEPEKNEEINNNGYEPQHTFFTIDDAVTPNVPTNVENKKHREHIPVDEEVYETYKSRQTTPKTTTVPSYSSNEHPSTEISKPTLKPRQKLRRRKQKPKHQLTDDLQNSDTEIPSKQNKVKLSEDEENVLKTRNKINHPNRSRNKFSTQSTPPSTISTSVEDEKAVELTTATTRTSESLKQTESSDLNGNVKRRVKIKFRNKLRTTTSDPSDAADFDSKHADNQISESENENFALHSKIVSETVTIPTTAYSGLILPKLKFKNEIFTTFPTTASESTVSSTSGSTSTIESTIASKIPRPRFSIKEIKRKQLAQSISPTSPTTTTTTVSTSSTPDGQRFNRFRASFNRRKNDTVLDSSSGEENNEKKKFFTLKTSPSTTLTTTVTTTTTTTESPPQSSQSSTPRRSTLPKRTFPVRSFTKPPTTETETSSTPKPSRSTAISSRGNFRAKLKKKGPENEISTQSSFDSEQNNSNFHLESIVSRATSTSTEAPYKHETSIMKIAKTPSSVSKPSNLIDNDFDQPSLATPDNDLNVSPSEHLQRVVELTLSGNDENDVFKSANIGTLSRRIPNYFTISTDDPILPIQAFFPQINTNE